MLEDGRVARLPCPNIVVQDVALNVPVVEGLANIVDITVDADVAVDTHGYLWRVENQTRIPIVGDARVKHVRGGAVTVSTGAGRQDAYAIGLSLAVPWITGCQTFGHAQ